MAHRPSRPSSPVVVAAILVLVSIGAAQAGAQDLTCWFPPGYNGASAKAITDALSSGSGLAISPRVATGYPEILRAFADKSPELAYVGSFVSALLNARGLSVPIVQKIDGNELYSGIMIYPKGGDPAAILKASPAEVSYSIGASSGESSAKAATGGKASIGVKDHLAAANAVKAGKAKAAFVKNTWWEANKDKFPEFAVYEVAGVSVRKNPDNILQASVGVSADARAKIQKAAAGAPAAFSAQRMDPFDPAKLSFSLDLMAKGGLDPKSYAF